MLTETEKTELVEMVRDTSTRDLLATRDEIIKNREGFHPEYIEMVYDELSMRNLD